MKITYPIRINRYLALNNYATRKGADELISNGFVFINGRKANLGDKVNKNDKIKVAEKKNDFVYYLYNKPIGILTNKDTAGPDILSTIKFPKKVFPVGRLDRDSHGSIILTNDGRITNRLLSPEYKHEKEYIVRVEPNFSDKFIELIKNGVKFDGIITRKCKAWRKNKSKNTFHIVLTEGKKRQIRRMCESLNHKVIDLKRIRILNVNLDNLKEGEYREIKGAELKEFLSLLKL